MIVYAIAKPMTVGSAEYVIIPGIPLFKDSGSAHTFMDRSFVPRPGGEVKLDKYYEVIPLMLLENIRLI